MDENIPLTRPDRLAAQHDQVGDVDVIRPFTLDYGETSFTDVTSVTPDDTKSTMLSDELKLDKIEELYATLSVRGNSSI